ncbi:hypothetical protein STEG23_029547 [Scotinomys teguina]
MEERISGNEDMVEEIDSMVKEYIRAKNLLTQHIQEIWDTMKRPNLRIIGIEEEESQLKNSENIFNKIIEENFLNLKKGMPIKELKSKWVKDLNINPDTLNLIEEKVENSLECIGTGDCGCSQMLGVKKCMICPLPQEACPMGKGAPDGQSLALPSLALYQNCEGFIQVFAQMWSSQRAPYLKDYLLSSLYPSLSALIQLLQFKKIPESTEDQLRHPATHGLSNDWILGLSVHSQPLLE